MSGDPPPDPGGGNSSSYCDIVKNNGLPSQMLKCLKISLDKRDETETFNLSGDELARLLLDNIRIPHSLIVGVDTSYFRRIKVWLKPECDIEKYKTTKAFWIQMD